MATSTNRAALTLLVNDERFEVNVDPATSAALVLRNELALKGVRIGCGLEQCGACTVIVDGQAVQSCATPVGSWAGRSIRTVEALRGRDPIQRALLKHNAGQCGFCLTGIVMAARALFDADPHPTDAEIRAALHGNLCRCGAQPRILRALNELAEEHD